MYLIYTDAVPPGMDAVLGPSLPLQQGQGRVEVPIEMAIQRQKSKPGSGLLAVKVIIDGPTRVLQITDIKQQVSPRRALLIVCSIVNRFPPSKFSCMWSLEVTNCEELT